MFPARAVGGCRVINFPLTLLVYTLPAYLFGVYPLVWVRAVRVRVWRSVAQAGIVRLL